MTFCLAALVLAAGQGASPFPKGPIDLAGAQSLDGKPATIEPGKHKATVLIFLSPDCPIANRYAPEMARIVTQYAKREVTFYRVYLLGVEAAESVAKHGNEFRLPLAPILDPNKRLVRATGVRVTPEVAVIGRDGTLRYRGRIDDQNVEHGKIRPNYRRDLRIALDEILAGKEVTIRHTAAIGCMIPKN